MPRADQAPCALFVFFGLIASGKSTLAATWARRHGMAYFNSDRVRKELAGITPETGQKESFNQGIYSQEFTRQTYAALLAKAQAEIAGGRPVVLDASYQEQSERVRVRELAKRLGCRVRFILCSCPAEETRRRLAARALDPLAVSDGRWEIYLRQKDRFVPPVELAVSELVTISTAAPVETLLEQLDDLLANRVGCERSLRRA